MGLENLIRRIGNIAVGITLSALITTASIGCGDSVKEGQAPGISEELQANWPIWRAEQLEFNKYKGTAFQYDNEVMIRPNFYEGDMPLSYLGMQTPGSGYMTGMSKYLKFQFEEFSNFFIYDNFFMLSGIVAIDNSNTLVAEAKLSYMVENDEQKVNMEEFHYDGGLLVYHCMSEVDFMTGIKISEFQKSGKKHQDYFFILPLGINGQ